MCVDACAQNAVDVRRVRRRRRRRRCRRRRRRCRSPFATLVCVCLLLCAVAQIVDGVGNSCLHYSAMWGHTDTLQCMLDAGTNPNIQNFQGDSALHKAFYKDCLPAVRMLVQRGADVNAVNRQGLRPGDYAQSPEGRALSVVRFVIAFVAPSLLSSRVARSPHCGALCFACLL